MFILTYLAIFIFGILIGNFVTPIFYRLPRNIRLSGRNNGGQPPCCSTCQHLLKFYEYLPILSWLSTRGRCNYCQAKINSFYLYIELIGGVLAVACAYLFGDNIELFFLKFCFSLNLILSIALYIEQQKIFPVIIAALIIEAAILATLQEATIINWLVRFSFAMIISTLLQKNKRNRFVEAIIATILPAFIFLDHYADIFIFTSFMISNILISALIPYMRKNLYISNSLIMLMFFLQK